MIGRSKPLRRGKGLERRTRLDHGGSQIKRTGRLERHTRLKPRRDTPRRSSYFEDRPYLAWVRLQLCAIAIAFGLDPRCCSPIVDPDHLRDGAGGGQRGPDPFAYPACRDHHRDQHTLRGPFKGWTGERRDALLAELTAISQTQWYGRPLVAVDLVVVRELAESGGLTRGMFAVGGA